jgi:hypothetical protein
LFGEIALNVLFWADKNGRKQASAPTGYDLLFAAGFDADPIGHLVALEGDQPGLAQGCFHIVGLFLDDAAKDGDAPRLHDAA